MELGRGQSERQTRRQAPLIVTFLYIQSSASESLPLIFVIACDLPQLVLLLSVTYRQLKGKQIAQYTADKFSTLLKQICKRNQAGDELSENFLSSICYEIRSIVLLIKSKVKTKNLFD